jgi:hypothetical protein
MSGPSLEGLNIVYPPIDNSQSGFDFSNPANLPELDAQLDLWTNLAFQSDEPFIARPLTPTSEDKAHLYQRDPVQQPQQFDLNNFNFFNQFNVDPFLVPPAPTGPIAPTVTSDLPLTDSAEDKQALKRVRNSKKTIDTSESAETESLNSPLDSSSAQAANVSASEDKRRRNTAASARFRAKKKEREAALEKKSKELETRVSELERECESLRRENGWLKGLVVGVTGASTGNATPSVPVPNAVPHGSKRKRPVEERPAHDLALVKSDSD